MKPKEWMPKAPIIEKPLPPHPSYPVLTIPMQGKVPNYLQTKIEI